jgi:hypothetical protein
LFRAFCGEWGADETAGVDGHEIHHFCGAEGCGADEVCFVFAGWVICDDHHSPGGDFLDDFMDWAKSEWLI